MEHKVVGSILIALSYILMALVGVFVFRHLLDYAPDRRFRLVPLAWVVLLAPVTVGQYYLDNYMSDDSTSVGHLLSGNLPIYVMLVSAWLSSYWRRRRNAQREAHR